MQLKDIVKTINDLTDDELLERLRQSRANRTIVRPAYKAHVERAEKKTTRAKVKKATDLFGTLSDEEREALIKQLSESGSA